MRPATIVWFERLYVAAVAMAFALPLWEARAPSGAAELTGAAIMLAIFLLLPIGLALLVTRRPNRATLMVFLTFAWLFGALWLIGVAGVAPAYLMIELHSSADNVAFALQLLAAALTLLLFTPTARAWLKTPRDMPRSAAALGRTFD